MSEGSKRYRYVLSDRQIEELKVRILAGEKKTYVARDLGISRETLYKYLRKTGERCLAG